MTRANPSSSASKALFENLRRTKEAVEQALREGYPRETGRGGRKAITAAFIAATRISESRTTVNSRVAPGGACEKHGFAIDWAVYDAEKSKDRARKGELGLEPTLPGYEIANTRVTYDKRGEIKSTSVTQVQEKGPEFEVPEGMSMPFVTVQQGPDGRIERSWPRYKADKLAERAAMRAAIDAFKTEIPREIRVTAPMQVAEDLLNQFTVTDLHFGMLAWREETGADYDLKIAEKLLLDWFAAAIALAPPAHTAVLAQLGDLVHYDSLESVTPTNRNVLDSDSRFQKIVRVALRTMRQIIRMLLEKHQHVRIIMADANHDPASEVWLREGFAMHYDDEPRVSVDCSPRTYYSYEWGETSLFYHHGHRRKIDTVDSVFAGEFRELYGRTKHSYAHIGHLHSDELKSTNLMKVERHETLAAPDAYAAGGGWLSGRSAKVITYSRRFGEVARLVLSPAMVAGASDNGA